MDTFGRSQDAHNLYFEIATNLGIQGLFIVGLLIYKMISILRYIRITASKIIEKLNLNDQDNFPVISDLRLIEAVSLATIAFIILRLILGLFGMDLYEIYWWFALGITVSLYSMLERIKTSLDQLYL